MTADSREAASGIGVFTLDDRLVVTTWDAWLARVTGIEPENARGAALDTLVPDLDARGLRTRFLDVLHSGEPQVLSSAFHRYLFPCAPEAPVEGFDRMQQRVVLGPLRHDTRIVGIIATVEDVTGHVARERALGEALRNPDARVREAAARQVAEAEAIETPDAFTAALASDDWRVRRAATRGLAPHAHRSMLLSLLKQLREGYRDFSVLSSALTLLSNADVDVTQPLIELLHDEDPDLRMQAALALGEHQRAAGIDALMAALRDPDANVRFHAIEALGRLRASEAVDALAGIAESEDFFLAFPAIDALARMTDPRVLDRLASFLQVPLLREAAVDAIGRLGHADSVPPLVALLDVEDMAGAVCSALVRIHDREELQHSGGAFVASEVRRTISSGGQRRLIAALGDERAEPATALATVGSWLGGDSIRSALFDRLGRPGAAGPIVDAIVRQGPAIAELLIAHLDDGSDEVRQRASIALGRIGDRRATPALVRLLDRDPATVLAAVGALAQLGDRRAYEPLLPLLGRKDVAIRQAAIAALNAIGHPAMERRIQSLLEDPDSALRESALRIAGYFGYPSCRDAVVARCGDPVSRVRRAALEALPYMDDPRATGVLTSALRGDTPDARAAAAQALGYQTDDASAEALMAALQDVDAWVRYYAIRALSARRVTGAAPAILKIAEQDPAGHVRIAALEAVGTLGGASMLPSMLAAIERGADEIAAAGLRGLPRIDDPRVAAIVRENARSASPQRRLAAIAVLADLSFPDAIELLEWIVGADTDLDVANAALDALIAAARVETPQGDSAVPALIRLASDPAVQDRCGARLARLPQHRVAALEALLADPSTACRLAAIDALARLSHPSASHAIRTALGDPDERVRTRAVSALDEVGTAGLLAVFAQLAEQDPSMAVRRAAAAAVRRHVERSK